MGRRKDNFATAHLSYGKTAMMLFSSVEWGLFRERKTGKLVVLP